MEIKKYSIRYADRVSKTDIPRLSQIIKKRIKNAIESRLTVDPVNLGKPLKYTLKGYRRIRAGDYRIVYKINIPQKIITIIYIGHRKDIYRDMRAKLD